ncbi:MAG: sigma-54-dependent transcriptional regulator [Sandaracinaceae bacterium]
MPPRLPPADREFFEQVSRATFANPFGDERDHLDLRIAEAEGDEPDLLERLVAKVDGRLSAIEARGDLTPDAYAYEDWVLLEHAVLFEAFHHYADPLDALIADQLEAGSTPLEVPFGAELLSRLVARGVEPKRAPRMLSLMWQMRRAYTFIVGGLSGVSPSMRRLRESLWSDIFTHDLARYERLLWDRLEDFAVILRGETGSGKGQAAAALGRSGYIPFDERLGVFATSFTELFVPINLSQFPESLIESELFGHKKGAFTGAVDSHQGVFDRCSPHGAIFLDEIGEVSIPVQIKLLRVLQERVFTPVGSHEEHRFEGRVIAATHRDLSLARAEGRFRDDFYYRLCADVIEVPPLRSRLAEDPEELDALLRALVPRIVGAPDDALVARVHQVVDRHVPPGYAWPGNVRELEQCVRRVLLTGHFVPEAGAVVPGDDADRLAHDLRRGGLEARELTARYCALLHQRHGTYEEVARITGLDRRTVRKHVLQVEKDVD